MDTKVIIGIIIGTSIVLAAIIAAIASFFTRRSRSGYASTLLECIINTFWKILFMIWYPFQAIIELANGILYRINSWIHDSFDTEKYRKNKEQKLIRKAVSTVLHSHSNLLNTYLNRRVAKVLTLLLQIISFITTYAGFTFFLGTVNPIAPLFMAITVQGGCFYLLNYTSSRKRTGGWKRNFLLGFLLLTSAATSYIGIFDGVVRPVEKIEGQYNEYAYAVKSVIDELKDQEYNTNIDYSLINKSLDIIRHTHSDADQAIQTLTQHADGIDTDKKFPVSWKDKDGIVHQYVTTEKDNEASNQKLDLQAEIGNLEGHFNKLSTYLQSSPSVNETLAACKRIIDAPEKITNSEDKDIKVWNSLKDALYECGVLYGKLYADKPNEAADYYEIMKLDEAIEDAEKRKLLETLYLPEFNEVISNNDTISSNSEKPDENTEADDIDISIGNEPYDEESDMQDDTGFFEWVIDSSYGVINGLNGIVVSKDATRAQEIRNIINKVTNQNYSKFSPLLSRDTHNSKKLKDAYEKAYIENTQIMPFTMPFTDGNVKGEAIFSLATAILVDFFSLLIAFALVNKQKSILYFKKVGDLRANREEMLEDCLMYICLNCIQTDTKNVKMSQSEIQDFVVKKINEVMRGFMEKVHPLYLSNDLNSFGYITEDEVSTFREDEKRLFFTLNNTALIHPCYNSEIIKIINSDFDEYEQGSTEPKADEELIKKYDSVFVKGKIFYLVSKNLHVWFCENFAELLQNSLLFNAPSSKNSPNLF